MIVSVSINPSLDVSAIVDRVEPDRKLRTSSPDLEAGGGGVNVAKVAHSLGAEVRLVAALGGHTGARVGDILTKSGIAHDRVAIEAETRESMAFLSGSTGRQYRFVLPGATLDHEEISDFHHTVLAVAESAGVVVLSGSLPPGAPPDLYRQIIDDLSGEPQFIVDTSGPALVHAARSPAVLLKPSVNELNAIAGSELRTEIDYIAAAAALLKQGQSRYVAVSLGPGGALLVHRDGEVLHVRPPAVRQISAVGAGDSMVAAIAVELERGGDMTAAVASGVAAGTAAVLTPGSQLCRPDDVAALVDHVVVQRR